MSQPNRTYKRLEALFSEARPASPDSPQTATPKVPAGEAQAEDLQAHVAGLEAQLARLRPAATESALTSPQKEDASALTSEPISTDNTPPKEPEARSSWFARLGQRAEPATTPPIPNTQNSFALSYTLRYTVFGILFGLAFPVFSLIIGSWIHSLPITPAIVTEIHHREPLLWVIDTAPFFLGLFAFFIGQREDRLRRTVSNLGEAHARLGTSTDLLEQRVRDLFLAVEVGQRVSAVRDIDSLLSAAVELVQNRFHFYYTQIYLTDTQRHVLVLRTGTGEIGAELLRRGHRLPISLSSINGRAAMQKRAVIVADTSQSTDFLPNPLLPNTRSEMAIPLIAGEQVLGVLDMQSEQAGALNETDLPALEAVAGQLAIAIQNAHLFAESQQARTEVEEQIHRTTREGWQDFLDAIERGERIGFAFDQTEVVRLEGAALSKTPPEASSTPITVTGAKIGAIQLVGKPDASAYGKSELVQAVAAQLGQHIENLRLMAQAKRYQAEAEQVVRRLTREGWETLQERSEMPAGYVYDLNEVKPLSVKDKEIDTALKQPLTVRDETIGELSVETSDQSPEAAELVNAVAQQLSSHIENLRLSELNERQAQREHTLRQITSALHSSTNPATIMRTAVKELGSILGRKTVVEMLPPGEASQVGSPGSNGNASDLTAASSLDSAVGGEK